jgi:iron complex transport system substrate-binding protein
MTFVRTRAGAVTTVLTLGVFLGVACASSPPSTLVPTATAPVVPTATTAPPPIASEAPQSISLTDGLGRTISLDAPAVRVVSMAPSNTEILYAVGAGQVVVGRDEFSDYPEQALDIPSIGGGFGEYNTEAIVSLQPDLVLAGGINTPDQVQTLEDLGLNVYMVSNPVDFDGLYANLEAVGTLTGHQAQAEELVHQLRDRVGTLTEKLAGAPKARVFFEVDGTDPTAPWSTGAGTFQDYLVRLAGGENVVSFEGWGQVNLEDLIASDPQVILFSAAPYIPTTVKSIGERPGWSVITAVKQGAVFGIDTDLTDLPGPRLVDGFEAISRSIHPELFK